MRRQGFEPDGTERWFVLIGEEQCGPFNAAEMAQRLDSGSIDWTTAIWRRGFRDWRAARRDAVLVTSIAGERGFASDTVRLNSAGSFVASEDTVVDRAPLPPMHDTGSLPGVAPLGTGAPVELPGAAMSAPAPASDPPPGAGPGSSHPPPATMLRLGVFSVRLPHSLVSVAAVSFAAGVLAAALWARFLGPVGLAPAGSAAVVQVAATDDANPIPDAGPVMASSAADAGARPQQVADISGEIMDAGLLEDDTHEPPTAERPGVLEPQKPSRELPKSQELRAAVRTVAAGVHGCLSDPKAGVDVLIYLDGPSGRVRDVQVRRPRLPPVRMRCVVNAVRRLQLEPFRRDELVYPHRFAW